MRMIQVVGALVCVLGVFVQAYEQPKYQVITEYSDYEIRE